MMRQSTNSQPSRDQTGNRANRTGSVLVLVAFSIVLILLMLSFAIDVGRMTVLRSEVQNAVDSGALAAQLQLQHDPTNIPAAVTKAREFVQANRVGSAGRIPDNLIQVEAGVWDADAKTFTATSVKPNAVRVFARQDNEEYSFAKIFGYTTFGAPGSAVATGTHRLLDIVMCLDLSGSMKKEGRIEALQNTAPLFVDVIQDTGGGNDQIGFMGLCADPDNYDPKAKGHTGTLYRSGLHATADHRVGVLEAELTTDYDWLRTNRLNTKTLVAGKYRGWTGTGAALGDSVHYLVNSPLVRPKAQRFIVLMSDGRANKPYRNGPGYARTMAQYATDNNVVVYTISLGSGADRDLMAEIAQIGGGKHFDASGTSEAEMTTTLTKAFQDIATDIRRTQLVK